MDIFWELHRDIPREGPGDAASTRRAWSMLTGLPDAPRLLDVGCGPGHQTLDLAACSKAAILAVDNHQPFLDELERRLTSAGLAGRVTARNLSMFALDLEPGSFDVIWSEGAVYIMGFERGLREWQPLLKPGGFLAVTELSWLKPDPPSEVKAFWDENYPAMQPVDENLSVIRTAGYREVGHFTLPESAWWDDYYMPLEKRIAALRQKYRTDEAAIRMLSESQREIDLYRQYSQWYGYVFYIMQK
jgi:SAM-dependent methyltransferase